MKRDLSLDTKSGTSFQSAAYLITPPPGWLPKSPGLILLHDWWGFDQYVQWQTERLSMVARTIGYAPDYLKGKVYKSEEEAIEASKGTDFDHAVETVAACIEKIAAYKDTTPTKPGETMEYDRFNDRIALVGFGLGASVAFAAASKLQDPRIRCLVAFYGLPKPGHFDMSKIDCAIQAHVVKDDPHAPPATAQGLERELSGRGRIMELHTWSSNAEEGKEDDRFPVHHGFLDDEHPLKHQGFVAQRTWMKAIPFLRAHLDSLKKQ